MKRFIVLLISMIAACTVSAQVSTQNYICSRKMLNNTGSSHVDDISYFDGLGRPFQSVNKTVQNNVTKQRLATLLEYDYYGRETNMWLPTSVMADYVEVSTFRNTAVGSSGYNDSYPYSQSIYEASPLNRPLQQYGAGKLWHSNNRAVRTEYLVNASDSDRACKFYTVNGTSLSGGTEFYAANLLNVIKTTDEGNNVSYTFTDKLGRIVLTRQMNGTEAHDTYYVYNDKGNLCFVLQPMYQTTADIELYAFEYKYDGHGNCIWKKLPGAEYIEYVYDNYDRMTYSQDGNQRKNNRWMYYQYDAMGRPSGQGECTEKNRDSNPVQHIRSYYDGYYILSQSGFNNPDFPKGNTSYIKGRLAGSIISVPGSGSKIYIAYFYDIKGRVMQETRSNLLGGHDVTITTYTFTDKPATVTHIHTASGKNTWIEVYTYSYDHADRISKVQHTLGGTTITLYDATYDDLGRLKTKSLHGSTTNKLTYTYNLRGWLTGITGTRLTQNLYYNTGVGTAKYNGSISSMTWKAGNESTVRGYKFTYDGLDRLLNGTYGEGEQLNSNSGRYSENVTGYDKNGNITGLERYGRSGSSSYGMCDALTYTLNGNQMIRVDDLVSIGAGNDETDFKDAVKQANEYTYDANGNLTKDLNKGITGITYNCLNLPNAVTFSDGSTVTYIYSADGTKLRAVHKIGSVTTTTDYCDNVIYENNTAKLLLTGEGYISLSDKKYHYYLQDHQGNNRVVVDSSGKVEETNHYYPFGGAFASTGNVQPYKYNGKELDAKKGLNWYDYGARMYDAALGRWHRVDPLAENYYRVSPYAYCMDNPGNAFDYQGKLVIFINGLHTGTEGASPTYWKMKNKPVNFNTAVMAHFGDWNARYYDGSLGGPLGFSMNMGSKSRYDVGYISGLRDAKKIISQLARDANGNITESIKVISHSMGGAYAKGFLQALVEYIKNHPRECNGISLSEYDFAPYQPYSQKAVEGVDTYQYSHKNDDWAGNAAIKGAQQMETSDDDDKGHSITSFFDYINSLPPGNYKYVNGKFVRY